jgi:hypothetical protein
VRKMTIERAIKIINKNNMLDGSDFSEALEIVLDTIEALQQENEQLQTQVARVREALRKASAWDRVNWFECDRCANMRDALATIDKAIGGKEDV